MVSVSHWDEMGTLVNLSTITKMELCLCDVSGKNTTKSPEITCHLDIGMSCSCRSLVGLWWSTFTHWHLRNLMTNWTTSCFMRTQNKSFFMSACVNNKFLYVTPWGWFFVYSLSQGCTFFLEISTVHLVQGHIPQTLVLFSSHFGASNLQISTIFKSLSNTHSLKVIPRDNKENIYNLLLSTSTTTFSFPLIHKILKI